MLIAKRRQSIADLAAFRIDFAVWLRTLTRRGRQIIHGLVAGERPSDLADRLGFSRDWMSQLRRRYQRDWQVFQGDYAAAA